MVRIGVIGCGAVGQMHLDNLIENKNCKVVAAADMRPELLAKVADKYGIEGRYTDHRQLLKSADVDAVVVVTNRYHTFSILRDCVDAGKAIFVEKPIAMKGLDAIMLHEAARAKTLVFHVGYQRRYDEGIAQALLLFQELLETKRYGTLQFANFWNFTGRDRHRLGRTIMTDEPKPPFGEVPIFPDAFDRFLNVVCHDVNLMNLFIPGEKEVLFADLSNLRGQTVTLKQGEVRINLTTGYNELNSLADRCPWDEGFGLYFQRATLSVAIQGPLMHDQCAKVYLATPEKQECHHEGIVRKASAFRTEMEHFIDCALREDILGNLTYEAAQDLVLIGEIFRAHCK